MKYRIPNPDNNYWFNICNEIIAKNECNIQLKKNDPNYVKYSLHHILPRSEYPELTNDKNNWLHLPVIDHVNLHYYMWKGDSKYAKAFWFCYVYFHKYEHYNISEEEYEQLKKDLAKYKK